MVNLPSRIFPCGSQPQTLPSFPFTVQSPGLRCAFAIWRESLTIPITRLTMLSTASAVVRGVRVTVSGDRAIRASGSRGEIPVAAPEPPGPSPVPVPPAAWDLELSMFAGAGTVVGTSAGARSAAGAAVGDGVFAF